MNASRITMAASCLAIAIGTVPATARAQAADLPAAEDDAGEIIVTATKRAESLNDVPMSISAASGDDLVSAGVKGAGDRAWVGGRGRHLAAGVVLERAERHRHAAPPHPGRPAARGMSAALLG